MSNSTAMQLVPEQPLVPAGELTIGQAFDCVVAGKLNSEQLGVMKELLAMDAERRFTTAFVALQKDLPTIVATSVIPNRGKYERFEDVMRVVGPLLVKHGFSVTFDQTNGADMRITVKCTLMHSGGHKISTPFTVRSGGRADSEIQADCKASTTAKRNAMLQCLNIVIRQDCLNSDEDAGIEGAFITPEQASALHTRVVKCKADTEAFLKFCGSPLPMPVDQATTTDLQRAFERIPVAIMREVEEMLTKKERKGK
jgi:hypothetical protein